MSDDLRVLAFTLPLPPSVNHSHRNYVTKTGQRLRVPTKRAEQWMSLARDTAYQTMRETGWTCPQGERVIVELLVWFPDRRRRDTHNLLKLLLDAIEGVAYDDDRWALPRIVDFDFDKANPRIEVACIRAR